MKRRRVIAQQSELPITAEPFALVAETGIDGARVTSERITAEQRRSEFESAQRELVPVNQND